MDNRDINAIRDVAKLDANMKLASEYHERRARGEALARNDKMMRDLNRWGPWIAAVVLFAFGLWFIAVTVDRTVADAVSQIGGDL